MADGFRIVVVPHVTGTWELRSRDHELSVVPAAEWGELPPFDPPDVAVLQEVLEGELGRAARLGIQGGQLDLDDFADAIATAREHGQPIEFHLY